MNEEERKRRRDTRSVLIVFALTVVIAVISIAWFMYQMITKS
jgi:hypothetical protein